MAKRKHIPYRMLRERMKIMDTTSMELAERIDVTPVTFSKKLRGRSPWRDFEMYAILDYLHVPHEDLYLYFPPAGRDETDKRKMRVDADLRKAGKAAVNRTEISTLKELVDGMYEDAVLGGGV